MKKSLLLTSILFLSACGLNEADFKSQIPERPAFEDRVATEEGEKPVELPLELNLEVPFFAQAPDGDWVEPWEEACEEASLILAHYGLKGQELSKAKFKELVHGMVSWQKDKFGYYESTTLAETQELYTSYFKDSLKIKTLENPSIKDLKTELAQGNLIVAPFGGRMLGNPFYSGEGPYYHMLVIKGYDSKNFITNDVGTKRGENFIYSHQTLMAALHDYRKENIESTPSRVLVLLPSSAKEEERL